MKDVAQNYTGRDMIGSHAANDDARHWRFDRTSHLPIGYFDSRRWYQTWDWIAVVMACAVIVGAMLGWT